MRQGSLLGAVCKLSAYLGLLFFFFQLTTHLLGMTDCMTHGSICSRALFSLKVLRLQEETFRQSEEAVKGKKTLEWWKAWMRWILICILRISRGMSRQQIIMVFYIKCQQCFISIGYPGEKKTFSGECNLSGIMMKANIIKPGLK